MGTLSRFSEADASQIEDGSHECNVPKLPLSGTSLSQPSDQGPTEVPVPMMDPMATPTIPAAAAPGSTPNTSLISSRLRSSQKGTPTQGNSGAARRVCLATREIVSLDPMHEHSLRDTLPDSPPFLPSDTFSGNRLAPGPLQVQHPQRP